MPESRSPHRVSFAEATRTWARIGLWSFGGPAGQIAVMHRVLVEEKRWISESRFLHALNYCMLLPGPEAQQLATYVGWLLHGWRGGVVAGTLFVVPGFLAILLLSILYALHQRADLVVAIFFGLKAATLAIVVEAVLRIGKRVLRTRAMVTLAALAFVGIYVFGVPFPWLVVAAGVVGLAGGRLWPTQFCVIREGELSEDDPAAATHDLEGARVVPTWGRAFRVTALWLTLWIVPVAFLSLRFGPDHVLTTIALFFSKVAVVTFGGAYAVLAYVAQQAVEIHGWLQPGEMLDGLGMAETTPGPLIQVVQFVGFMGAFRAPEPFGPIVAACIASVVTTWVTFVPCFLWIFLGAPHVERLRGNRILSAGLSAITAAVVGVVLNLATWFAVHVAFARIDAWRGPGMRVLVPDLASADFASIAIAAGAFVAIFVRRWNMLLTLGVAVVVGLFHVLVLRPWIGG